MNSLKFGLFSVVDYHESFHNSVESLYAENIQLAKKADQLQLDSFWVTEHHFAPYGLCPSPSVFLSYLAASTKHIKLAPAVSVLPFHNPVHLAERLTMVDQLSQGRLEIGVGKGYLEHEYSGHGISTDQGDARFRESLEIVKKLIKQEDGQYQGNYYNIPSLKINVPTYKNRKDIKISIGSLKGKVWKNLIDSGYSVLGIPYLLENLDEIKANLPQIQIPKNQDITMALHIHVGHDHEQAIKDGSHYLTQYCKTRAVGNKRNFDELMEKNLVIMGGSDKVGQTLKMYKDLGVTRILGLMNFGGMPIEKVELSLEIIKEQILPYL